MSIDRKQARPLAALKRREVIFGACCMPLLSACADKVYQWREQVRLQDGQTVLVERSAQFRENWVAGGGGGSENKGMSLRILQASADAPPVWSDRFVPIVLDRDPKMREWVIVATFYHCDSWYELGKPKLPYTEFRYREGRWTRQALDDQWIGHAANVLAVDLTNKADMTDSRVLTVERKEAIVEASFMAPEYRRIVERWSTGC